MEVTIGKARLQLVEGDITDEATDAIVNAAHWDLRGGQGVDGAIQWKAGPEILKECELIGGCPIGDAVVTGAGNLKARYIIHTVGPVYDEGDENEAALLASAYRRSLQLAVELKLKSIAFPSLSTGAFCYPIPLAAPIAMQTIVDFLAEGNHELELVRFVLYKRENIEAYGIYARALQQIPIDHTHL